MREACATDLGGNRQRIPGQNGDSRRDSSRDSGKGESILRWHERWRFSAYARGSVAGYRLRWQLVFSRVQL